MSRVRHHLDERVNSIIATALRRYGIEVTTTVEAGLRTLSDQAQWEFAQHEGRVIVTHDADFPRLASTHPHHAGIAYCKKDSRTLRQIIDVLILIYEVMSAEEMCDPIEYLWSCYPAYAGWQQNLEPPNHAQVTNVQRSTKKRTKLIYCGNGRSAEERAVGRPGGQR